MRGLFGIAAWLFATCFLTFLHPLTQPLSLLNCQAVPFFDRGGLTHRQFSRQIDSFMLVGGLLPRFAHVRVYLASTSTSRTSRILCCLCDPPSPSALCGRKASSPSTGLRGRRRCTDLRSGQGMVCIWRRTLVPPICISSLCRSPCLFLCSTHQLSSSQVKAGFLICWACLPSF